MRKLFVRSAVVVFLVFAGLFVAEFVFEWIRLGRPGLAELSWADSNNAKLVDVLSPMARAYNNVLAMLLATIGLAIPLTANMHTPKLIDIFLRDRLNQIMLFVMALGAANVLWVAYIIGPEFAPTWAIRLAVAGCLVGWAVLIPYFFYVVRFLDPSNVIARLRDQANAAVDRVAEGNADLEATQDVVHERLDQIGTIVLKSLDRADRGVALEGVWAFKQIVDHHGAKKSGLPEPWFKVDRRDFVGLSNDALEMLCESRTWLERKALGQMFLVYQHALSKASDTVSSMSDATRVIAVRAAERGDLPLLTLAIHFFNSYLRDAIKKKNVRAIYDVFYQYTQLARDVRDRPEMLREIGRAFLYYSDVARRTGLTLVPQLAAFDLGFIVRRAYEAGSPVAPELLEQALSFEHRDGPGFLPLAVKAKLILGGFFVEKDLPEGAARVRESLRGVAPEVLASAEKDILSAERCFFEVTDRQTNVEYVPPERREPVGAFVASLAGGRGRPNHG